jgi:SET domain-containing protein
VLAAICWEEVTEEECINHSCDPNLGFKGMIELVALRDIGSGEQVTFDYAMCMTESYGDMECWCGSERCRGRFTGNDWKLPELQQRYRGHFQPYIEEKITRQFNQAMNIYVEKCELGLGVFAVRDFAKGEIILEFIGQTIQLEDVLAKGVLSGNPLQVGNRTYIDLEPPGLFANHSCAPNAGIRHDRLLVALRSIKRGEEIRYDYSTTMLDGLWTMQCQCGVSNCRKLISDFYLLPPKIQQHYLHLGVVQDFIAKRFFSTERS